MTQVLDPDFSSLLVQHKSQVAKDIWSFRLVHPEGQSLPVFTAGAHITVQTPAGQRRNYSCATIHQKPDFAKLPSS
jgi:phthalate 4,5-dioxygenase reductase component